MAKSTGELVKEKSKYEVQVAACRRNLEAGVDVQYWQGELAHAEQELARVELELRAAATAARDARIEEVWNDSLSDGRERFA